jgi:hypothetical protein
MYCRAAPFNQKKKTTQCTAAKRHKIFPPSGENKVDRTYFWNKDMRTLRNEALKKNQLDMVKSKTAGTYIVPQDLQRVPRCDLRNRRFNMIGKYQIP